jgi:hypothetical protein
VLQAWVDPLGALVRGGALVPLGLAVMGLAAIKRFLARRSDLRHAASLRGLPHPYLQVMRTRLAAPTHGRATVESLMRSTGWTEAEVVHTLALLRDGGEASEELDLETGEFYYIAQRPPSRDLSSRLGELHP